MPEVLILTGPPASGKSTVAEALAERYDRVAHIDVAVLRGFVTPTGRGPSEARERQRALGIRNACVLARNFLEERIAVIIDDIVTARDDLLLYLEGLKAGGAPVHFVRLLPRLDVCLERNAKRREGRVSPERLEAVYRAFELVKDSGGVSVDNSELSAYEAADKLQALTTSGESLVWAPPAAAIEQPVK